MPSNIAHIDASQRLPTCVGIENEVNSISPREMGQYLQRALAGTPAQPSGEELAFFEGDLFHITDVDGNVWKAKYDNSCAAEMNTPALATVAQLQRAKGVIGGLANARFPARTPYEQRRAPSFDANTGMHLHFDLSRLAVRQAVTWLALLHRHQPFIYRAFHVATPRLRFCAPLDAAVVSALIDAPPATLHDLASAFGDERAHRDVFVNVQNLAQGGIGTGELRCFNATANASLVTLAVGLGMRAYQIAAASKGPVPQAWRHPTDNAHAFAADFGLDAGHSLLRGILAEAARPLTYHEQVINDSSCFRAFPEVQRDDLSIAQLAVTLDAKNLAHVGPRAALNPQVVWSACVRDGEAMALAHPYFRTNRTFAYELMAHAADILPHVDAALRNDMWIVARGFAEGSPQILSVAGAAIRSNHANMQYFVREFAEAVQFAQLPLDQAFALAHEALLLDAAVVRCLPPELIHDGPLLSQLVRLVPEAQAELSAHQRGLVGPVLNGPDAA